MKTILSILLLTLSVTLAFGKPIKFQIANKTGVEIQVFYQIIQTTEKDNPEYIFNIAANSNRLITLKVKKGEKIKIIGYGGGIETLPIVRSFQNLVGDPVELELVIPKVEKIDIVDLNDALAKIKNDNFLKILLDSNRYSSDELPILGTFVFYNRKNNTTLKLPPTFWRNANEIRSINKQYFETIDYVSISNAANLNLSGVPFLQRLGASFANTNLLEIIWRINNAHIQQWQPTTKNVFDIIQEPSSKPFVDACVLEMNTNRLGGGEYNLFFISSALVVDNIVVSAKKYNKIIIGADVEIQAPTPNTEIVKPLGVNVNYAYSREKLYSNIDSSATVFLKFLAQDCTPVLNAYIDQAAKNAQKTTALNNLVNLKSSITNQYSILQSIDNSLILTDQIEAILPIIDITIDLTVKPEQYDSLGNNITVQSDKEYNRKVNQFNSILKNIKASIAQYKVTIESIEKLNQPTDYYKILNSITAVELDKKVVKALADQRR